MKRFALILLALLLCLSCAAAQEGEAAQTAVTKVGAPLYDAPGEPGAELMRYFIGTQVEVLEEADEAHIKVRVGAGEGSLTGYMERSRLAFGERAKRIVEAEQVFYRGTELQTSNLYSAPRKDAPVLDDMFRLPLRSVLGYSADGVWVHVRERDGSTGFVCLDELEDEEIVYDFEPYVRVQPLEGEMTLEEAIAYAREVILTAEDSTQYTGIEGRYADAATLDACTPEAEVLYYFDTPDTLMYVVAFRDPDEGYIYAGLSFEVRGGEIFHVSGGNG